MIAADELSIGSRPCTLTSSRDRGSPRLGSPSMTFHSGPTPRCFLKSSALALASLGIAPRALSAPKLNLKKPIKIGCQTILSGPLGGYGEFMKKGALLAMEEINAQGGIGGSPIALNFRDEELKVDVGAKNTRYFVDDWGAGFLIRIGSSSA